MKKTTKLLTVTLAMVMAACTLTACGGGASEGNTITFGTNAEFPPFEYVTSNGVIGEYDDRKADRGVERYDCGSGEYGV